MTDKEVRYKRVLLKLSGEALLGELSHGMDVSMVTRIAQEISRIASMQVQVAVVIGGGNIVRGMEASVAGLDRVTADYMGMLATIINALALRDALERQGVECRVQSAIEMRQVAEPFIPRRAMRHLEKERVVILAGGLGSPFFTTDTTAALRATELNADVLLKATKVDGIYDRDPNKYSDAKKLNYLGYMEALNQGLSVMDSTALTLCMDNKMPIIVFDLHTSGNIEKVVCGESIGTLVDGENK